MLPLGEGDNSPSATTADYARSVVSVPRAVMGTLLAALGLALLNTVELVSIASRPTASADIADGAPLTQEYCNANYGDPMGRYSTGGGSPSRSTSATQAARLIGRAPTSARASP